MTVFVVMVMIVLVAEGVRVAVPVTFGFGKRHGIDTAVAHAGLGQDAVGHVAHLVHRPEKNHGFEALFVIEVHVHHRVHDLGVLVLALGHAGGKTALVVVVDVADDGRAFAFAAGDLFVSVDLAQDVAEGFRAVAVAALADQALEEFGGFVCEGEGDALHGEKSSDKSWISRL